MKKLILLISFLTLSWNTFSQTDTTKVCLPAPIARQVAKDLIRLDGYKQEVALLEEKVIKIEEREKQKDAIITLLLDKDKNNQYIITNQDQQKQQYEKLSNELEAELRQTRKSNIVWKIAAFAGGAFSAYTLVK
jgi:hypothetical protein